MKTIYTLLILVCPLLLFSQQNSYGTYSINFPSGFPPESKTDIVNLLSRATSKQWEVSDNKEATKGIILKYKDNPAFKTKESFRLQSNGSNLLIISSSSTEGLIFGMYKHFRALGFKFYLPDDLYTIIPSVNNPFGNKKDLIDQPFLQIRDFFGTGGFGSGRTDPDRLVEKSWNTWKLRNGFGSAYPLAGHRGENFILENQDRLALHPEWLASPLKNNGQLNISAKLNYLNKEALDYYTNWTIQPFKTNFKPSAPNITEFVSIEPSDGGGYLNESDPLNKKLPSVSDQVFGAANLAASKLDKLFPDNPNIGVNLYAYSSHAEPPSFTLHRRVFVQIIPYQFQNIAFGPAFIKRWATKAKRFGLYDYYKYPDSNWDLPGGYMIDELIKRAMNAARFGSEGSTYESSYSKFATGIPMWVLSRYMCDGIMEWEKQYNQFISDLYGDAAPSIQKLFKLFYRQSQFSSAQLNNAVLYLQEAEKKNKDSKVAERLYELKLYLTYVQLYFDSQNQQNGNLEQRLLPVSKMAWTIYQKKIIHSYRIMQLVSYAFLNTPAPDAATAERYKRIHILSFPETDDKEAYWKQAGNYAFSEKQLTQLYNNLLVKNSQAEQIPETNSMTQLINIAKKNYKPVSTVQFAGSSLTRGYFALFAEKSTEITIKWQLTNNSEVPASVTLSGTNDSYTVVYDKKIAGKEGSQQITIPSGESFFFINANNNTEYRLQLLLNGVYIYFSPSPRTTMAFLNKENTYTYDPVYYPSYFFMPANTKEVKYKVQLNALQIIMPDGKPVATKLLETLPGGFEIRSFIPPANQLGKFWKAVITGNFNYEMLNIPDVYFLFQEKGQ